MLALLIPDVKSFMTLLLLRDPFDSFLLQEAQITTNVTYSIDGKLHEDFFDEPLGADTYTSWRDIKGHCLNVIKGKRTPLNFKFVFKLNDENTGKLLRQTGIDLLPEQISGLYFNCQFDGSRLLCTSGTALNFFTLDKVLDQVWDDMLTKFMKQHKIFFVQS